MKMDAMLRNISFKAVDKLKGNIVKTNLKDITVLLDTYTEKDHQERLNEFLKYAVNTTPFYKHLKGFRSLNEFPVIQKRSIRDHYKDFISEQYLEKKNELVLVHTSGSYGVPVDFLLTKYKKKRQHAEVVYFGRWVGYDIGVKHAYFRVTVPKSKVKLFLQNEYFSSCINLTDEWLEMQKNELLNKKIQCIIGFSSAITCIANYCISKGYSAKDFNVTGIITSSEALTKSQRAIISQAFNCTITSRYSTEEFGIIANECPECGNHHINTATYYVEILKIDNDEKVRPGEVGRVVVTDLYSQAMPLIRYDTGDLATLKEVCNCGRKTPILGEIQGRTIEMIYTVDGRALSPFFINQIMHEFSAIIQYQFIQMSEKYFILNIVVKDDFVVEEKMIQWFKDILGNGCIFEVVRVIDILPLKSGKRPYVINKFIREKY